MKRELKKRNHMGIPPPPHPSRPENFKIFFYNPILIAFCMKHLHMNFHECKKFTSPPHMDRTDEILYPNVNELVANTGWPPPGNLLEFHFNLLEF